MHRLLYILPLLWCSCTQHSHSQEVPKRVQANFEVMYPDENDPDWHIDAHGNYEAHFKQKGKKYRADFAPNGDWIETERSIKTKNLPKAILTVINEKYSELKISEVEEVHHHSKGLFYDVEFKRKGKNKDVEFKKDGSIIYITP